MATVTFVKEGRVVNLPISATVADNQIITVGGLTGVARLGGASGAVIPVQIEGVFEGTATATIAAGATVYYTSAGITAASSGATLLGHALNAVTSGGLVKVVLK